MITRKRALLEGGGEPQRAICAYAALGALALIAIASGAAAAADLPRKNILLPSALSVDPVKNTVTLPIHKGRARGRTVWYIVTDSSDAGDAARRGVVYTPLLAKIGTAQHVARLDGVFVFDDAPDFRPVRSFAPGDAGFPPKTAQPGSVANGGYSPFIRIDGGPSVLNAPVVAAGDGPFDAVTHTNTADRVLAFDTATQTVTLLLSHGFADGVEVVYISTEASDPAAATIERATYVPTIAAGEAAVSLIAFANGQTGRKNPNAQGLGYAALDGDLAQEATLKNASALTAAGNILTAAPFGENAAGYSPLWEVNIAVWSPSAVIARQNVLQKDQDGVYNLIRMKTVTGPNDGPYGPAGFFVNCPIIAVVGATP